MYTKREKDGKIKHNMGRL